MDDYLLGFSLSEEDLELYFRLGWLIVDLEGVEISRLDLDRINGTAYWLSWRDVQLYSSFSSLMYSLSYSQSYNLWVVMNYLRMLAT